MSLDFWPGTLVDGFESRWADVFHASKLKATSAASVEKRRSAGTDKSTFLGMSKKADKAMNPYHHKPMEKRAKVPKGPTKASVLRAALAAGPMDGVALSKLIGVPHRNVRKVLQYDIEQGAVVTIPGTKPMQFSLAVAA